MQFRGKHFELHNAITFSRLFYGLDVFLNLKI